MLDSKLESFNLCGFSIFNCRYIEDRDRVIWPARYGIAEPVTIDIWWVNTRRSMGRLVAARSRQ